MKGEAIEIYITAHSKIFFLWISYPGGTGYHHEDETPKVTSLLRNASCDKNRLVVSAVRDCKKQETNKIRIGYIDPLYAE